MSWVEGSRRLERGLRTLFARKVVVLYGPNEPPPVMDVRSRLKGKLRESGFVKTSLVTDFPDEIGGERVDPRTKSFHWVEEADFNIFLFIVGADHLGVGLELEHGLDLGQLIISKSLCAEEFDPGREETEGVVSEILRHHDRWKALESVRFARGAEVALFDVVYRFLERKVLGY